MDSEIGNIETAECERLLSSNVVQAQIYGSKEPVCEKFDQFELKMKKIKYIYHLGTILPFGFYF